MIVRLIKKLKYFVKYEIILFNFNYFYLNKISNLNQLT